MASGALFTVVCCVISFSYKASRSNKSKGVCYFPCLMYVHLTYSLSTTWDSLATQSIACGGLKIRQPATIYCHCQVNLLLQHYYHAQHGVSFSNYFCCLVFKLFVLSGFQVLKLLLKSRLSEKATKFEKNLPPVLFLLSKNNCFVKTGGIFFQILWPSHNV